MEYQSKNVFFAKANLAAAVLDITAGTTPELAHLEPRVGSHYKRSGTGFGVTQNCSTPPSLEPVPAIYRR
jgi:hypothetical protein